VVLQQGGFGWKACAEAAMSCEACFMHQPKHPDSCSNLHLRQTLQPCTQGCSMRHALHTAPVMV
jgi:hypothetical protein